MKKIALLICRGKENKIYIVYFHNNRVMKYQDLLHKDSLLHCSFLETSQINIGFFIFGILVVVISASEHQGCTGSLEILLIPRICMLSGINLTKQNSLSYGGMKRPPSVNVPEPSGYKPKEMVIHTLSCLAAQPLTKKALFHLVVFCRDKPCLHHQSERQGKPVFFQLCKGIAVSLALSVLMCM